MAFIVFEGGEGSGKSTQANLLHGFLTQHEIDCLLTREPGGTPLAENIRNIFKELHSHGDLPVPLTELMLVMAARAQHFHKKILPAMNKNQWLVCDRFLDSSYVYQSIVGGVDKTFVDTVAKGILGQFVPDLTFVFLVDRAVAKERMSGRRPEAETKDRLDAFEDEMHNKINAGFETLVQKNFTYPNGKVPKRIVIDGARSIDECHAQIVQSVVQEFNLRL